MRCPVCKGATGGYYELVVLGLKNGVIIPSTNGVIRASLNTYHLAVVDALIRKRGLLVPKREAGTKTAHRDYIGNGSPSISHKPRKASQSHYD